MAFDGVVSDLWTHDGRPVQDIAVEGTGVLRVVAAGEIDALHAPRLHRIVLDLLYRYRPRRIDLDLSRVSFLDSVGIRRLLVCLADCQQTGCRLVLVDPQPMQMQVLRVTALLEIFGLSASPPGSAKAR